MKLGFNRPLTEKCSEARRPLGGVLHLRAKFLVPPCSPWLIVTIGEVDGGETPSVTSLNSSSYLLILALAVTAVIAVVALYFAMRRRRRTLLVQGRARGSGEDGPVC